MLGLLRYVHSQLAKLSCLVSVDGALVGVQWVVQCRADREPWKSGVLGSQLVVQEKILNSELHDLALLSLYIFEENVFIFQFLNDKIHNSVFFWHSHMKFLN